MPGIMRRPNPSPSLQYAIYKQPLKPTRNAFILENRFLQPSGLYYLWSTAEGKEDVLTIIPCQPHILISGINTIKMSTFLTIVRTASSRWKVLCTVGAIDRSHRGWISWCQSRSFHFNFAIIFRSTKTEMTMTHQS